VKCQRLGLRIRTKDYVQAPVYLPRDLPSVEEALKMLAGALKSSLKPGLGRVEVQRLQAVATISKTYKELLVDYINYREIETKLKEMQELNAQLLKERSQSVPSQSNPTSMAGNAAEPPSA
jgi:non-homologous end joining protein Ku